MKRIPSKIPPAWAPAMEALADALEIQGNCREFSLRVNYRTGEVSLEETVFIPDGIEGTRNEIREETTTSGDREISVEQMEKSAEMIRKTFELVEKKNARI